MRCCFTITLKQLRGDDIDQGLCCYDIIVDLFVVLITICIAMINIRFNIVGFRPYICILHGKNTMEGISKYKCPRNKLLYSTEAINCFLLTQWMLDVTDKGIINQVLAYSNSANAKQFSYRLFVVLWRPQLRNGLGLKLMIPCKIRG